MTTPILAFEDLSIGFRRKGEWQLAVRGVDLAIHAGETVGLVGESGCGKSTLALAGLGYLPANASIRKGQVLLGGQSIAAMASSELRRWRGNRIAAVYQNPSSALNPALTIGRQISEIFEYQQGLTADDALEAARDMLGQVRIANPARLLSAYPYQISGGMQQRVVIAMALAGRPDLLILDEPTTALDASVQAEILALFDDLQHDLGLAMLFISHDLGVVRAVCERAAVMYAGEVVESGPVGQLFEQPRHSYTAALIDCVPDGKSHWQDERHGVPAAHPPGPTVLKVENLVVAYDSVRILDQVSLSVRAGETLALVGESGSGKSTLARALTGLSPRQAGQVILNDEPLSAALRQRSHAARTALQMVFQSPENTLNPSHRIGAALARAIRELSGLSRRQAGAEVPAKLNQVSLDADTGHRRPHQLSGGQRQRVAIARAFAGDPQVVILDEPTSALDVSVQATVLDLLIDLQQRQGTAYLFISHDLAVVRYIADRLAVMFLGRVMETGPVGAIFNERQHPYTAELLAAIPGAHRNAASRPGSGVVTGPKDRPSGCAYAARCPYAMPHCAHETPPVRRLSPEREIHCHLTESELPGVGPSTFPLR